MRKIDKSIILATVYKEWEADFEQKGAIHGIYNSSKNKFYNDVIMNLLHCQKGVCAYTEIKLCDIDKCAPSNWKNGRYKGKYKPKGNLDHFDPHLKTDKAWLWSNLFVIDTDVNTKVKGSHSVDAILKPDLPSYTPSNLLEYDAVLHIFKPHSSLADLNKVKRLETMIDTLGINWDEIRDTRRKYLTDIFNDIEMGFKTIESVVLHQFFTAFEMSKSHLEKLLN